MAMSHRTFSIRINTPLFSKAYGRPTKYPLKRWQSTIAAPDLKPDLIPAATSTNTKSASPLSRLPTTNLVRSLLLASVFTSPILYKFGLAGLSWIANSKSSLLSPDKNILLRALIRPLIYNHFCAGTNATEVGKTVAEIKKMGYAGVILCYGKEIVLNSAAPKTATAILKQEAEAPLDAQIDLWRDGNLLTLSMVGAGDYIGIKYTGAGPTITEALAGGRSPPKQMLDAMDTICKQAQAQDSLIWVDAEQQVLQPTIDRWTIDFMRRYNRNGQALVSNTIQAYLKASRDNVAAHLRVAQHEGWTLGIKLVRGAYIGSEVRSRIHDNKAETDACYNSIVQDILTKSLPGFDGSDFPDVQLFLAGHNVESIRRASALYRELLLKGAKCASVRFGQLQGMADDISCELLQSADNAKQCDGLAEKEAELHRLTAPKTYKCLTWGSVQECMQYLVRRAIENQGATERMKGGTREMRAELRRRMFPS